MEEFDVKTRWIPLRDYAAYRRDTLAVSLWTKKQIVLQRSREPAAAARPNR